MLGESNGAFDDPFQGNQLVFSVWTGLICSLFKDHRVLNVYTSDQTQHEVLVDVVLQVSENQCNFQVFRKIISARLKKSSLDGREQSYIIYAQDLTDAWNILEMIWQRFNNHNGDELFLILTSINRENSESVKFVHKAWIQLYYFSVLIADTTQVHDFCSGVCLNILIANPYKVENNSELLSYRNFKFTEGSGKADWILMTSHLKSRLRNLHGYPIKITMHNFKGLSEPVFNTKGKLTRFMGYEGRVINEFARIFNFTPKYNLPRDGIPYGGELKNGSFTGGIRDLEEGFADIYGNRIRFTVNTLQQSQYLKIIEQNTLVVLVPKSLPQLKIIGTLFSILDGTASKVSILFISLNIIAWTVVKVNNDIVTSHKDLKLYTHREKFNALVMVLMKTVCIVSNTSFQTPTCSKERIFYAGLSIWALAVTNIYIGTITTRLAIQENSEIDTMKQLQQSGLKIVCMKYACNDMTAGLDKENAKQQLTIRQLLAKKLILIYSSFGVPQRIAYDRDTALLGPNFVVNSMVEETVSKDGGELIHMMKEPVNKMFSSLVVRRGLPLLRRLENTQTWLLEGGLLDHWQMSIKYEFFLKRNRTSLLGSSSNNTPLTLNNFRFTFLLWGFFTMVSILIFILELIYHQIKLN